MKKPRKYYTPQEKVAILRRHLVEQVPAEDLCEGYCQVSSLAAFSPPAAAARSLIPSLKFSGTLPQNGRILLNLTVPGFLL